MSENIEIEHAFQSRACFHFSSSLYTSCLSAFNPTITFLPVYTANLK